MFLGNLVAMPLQELGYSVDQYVSITTPKLGALGTDLYKFLVHVRVELIVPLRRLLPDPWQLGSRLLEALQLALRLDEYFFKLARSFPFCT